MATGKWVKAAAIFAGLSFTKSRTGVINGGGASDKVGQLVVELGDKGRVVLVLGVSGFQLVDGVRQGLGDKTAAIDAEVAPGVGLLVLKHGF